jgi:hypothetical protein
LARLGLPGIRQAKLSALFGPDLDPPLPATQYDVALDADRICQRAGKPQTSFRVHLNLLLVGFDVRELLSPLLFLKFPLDFFEE